MPGTLVQGLLPLRCLIPTVKLSPSHPETYPDSRASRSVSIPLTLSEESYTYLGYYPESNAALVFGSAVKRHAVCNPIKTSYSSSYKWCRKGTICHRKTGPESYRYLESTRVDRVCKIGSPFALSSNPHFSVQVETLLEQLDSNFDEMSARILDQSTLWRCQPLIINSRLICTYSVMQMSSRVDSLEASIQDIINADGPAPPSLPQSPSISQRRSGTSS